MWEGWITTGQSDTTFARLVSCMIVLQGARRIWRSPASSANQTCIDTLPAGMTLRRIGGIVHVQRRNDAIGHGGSASCLDDPCADSISQFGGEDDLPFVDEARDAGPVVATPPLSAPCAGCLQVPVGDGLHALWSGATSWTLMRDSFIQVGSAHVHPSHKLALHMIGGLCLIYCPDCMALTRGAKAENLQRPCPKVFQGYCRAMRQRLWQGLWPTPSMQRLYDGTDAGQRARRLPVLRFNLVEEEEGILCARVLQETLCPPPAVSRRAVVKRCR